MTGRFDLTRRFYLSRQIFPRKGTVIELGRPLTWYCCFCTSVVSLLVVFVVDVVFVVVAVVVVVVVLVVAV